VEVRTPGGRTVRVGGDGRRAALLLAETGFYEARRPDAPAERPTVVAVNVDVAESDPARVEPAELVRAVQTDAAGAGEAVTAGVAALGRDERERQQSAWWYLLAGALALLAAEAALANRRATLGPRPSALGRS
jgi:hypothetical protein